MSRLEKIWDDARFNLRQQFAEIEFSNGKRFVLSNGEALGVTMISGSLVFRRYRFAAVVGLVGLALIGVSRQNY